MHLRSVCCSDRQTQTQDASESAAVTKGRNRTALLNKYLPLEILTHSLGQKHFNGLQISVSDNTAFNTGFYLKCPDCTVQSLETTHGINTCQSPTTKKQFQCWQDAVEHLIISFLNNQDRKNIIQDATEQIPTWIAHAQRSVLNYNFSAIIFLRLIASWMPQDTCIKKNRTCEERKLPNLSPLK